MKIINLFLLISFNFFHFFAEHQILVKGWAGIWITLQNVKYFFRLLPRSLPRSRGNVINVITGKFQFAQLYVLLCSINPHKFYETQNSTIGIVASLLAWKFLLKMIFSGKWKYKYSLKFSVLTSVFLHSGRRAYLQYLHLQYILFLDNGYCKYLHTQKVLVCKAADHQYPGDDTVWNAEHFMSPPPPSLWSMLSWLCDCVLSQGTSASTHAY